MYAGLYCIDTSKDNLTAVAGDVFKEMTINIYECNENSNTRIKCADKTKIDDYFNSEITFHIYIVTEEYDVDK